MRKRGLCCRKMSVIVRSLYLTMFQAIGAIGIVYELAPPSLEDLTHLAVSGLVDSLNEV